MNVFNEIKQGLSEAVELEKGMKPQIDDKDSRVCGDCDNFIGLGDWNLCCKEKHDPIKYPFGFLCYKDTPACDKFIPKQQEETKDDI